MLSIRLCAVALAGAALLLGACATPQSPTPQPTETGNSGAAQVSFPWREGMRQLGVNVLWEDSKDDDDEVTRAKAIRLLDHLVNLNANSVSLNFPFVMDGSKASTVRADAEYTPSPERIAIFLEEAAARRLRVTLRPLLDERSLVTTWRGKIAPTDLDQWFAGYSAFLAPYAEVAARHGAAEFVAGVEFNSIQADPRWASLVSHLRTVFPGRITYAANFDVYQRKVPTPPVDAVGVDAYFPVKAPDDADVPTLLAAWEDWLDTYAGADASTLVLQEVGIAAQDGAYAKPSQWGSASLPLNLELQKTWYDTVCRVAETRDLAGLYFWNIRMHHNPGQEDPLQDDRLTFVDRPAQTVLKDCYARLGGQR